jgi:hypothetical protein
MAVEPSGIDVDDEVRSQGDERNGHIHVQQALFDELCTQDTWHELSTLCMQDCCYPREEQEGNQSRTQALHCFQREAHS